MRCQFLYLFYLVVDVGEIADEALAHVRMTLDLFNDSLLVQSQDVVFQYQFIGKTFVFKP